MSPVRDEVGQYIDEVAGESYGRLVGLGWICVQVAVDGLGAWEHGKKRLRLIHSVARELDGEVWAHVSVSRFDRKMPSWRELRDTWRVIYPGQVAVVVIPPELEHVNIAEVAHAWGCLTNRAVPDFTHGGRSI